MGRLKKDFYVADPSEIDAVLARHEMEIIRLQFSVQNQMKFVIEQISTGERVQCALNLGKYPNRQRQGIAHVIGMGFKPVACIIHAKDLWLQCEPCELSLLKQWDICAIRAADVNAADLPSHEQVAPMPAGLPAMPLGDHPGAYAFELGPEVWASLTEA